ncbi:dTMP kinase [Fodinibius sp. Rm-B-1B1-1]|uniref:dTMP kinase n=1 Tax=Fodinibius alkaliphilus TaxID=3140241 RepID=UPI00315A8AA8
MFITFEGIDGSGKSTQIANLKKRFEQKGTKVHVFRDPGGPVVSEKVRELLLNPNYDIDPVTELLLFSASRSQLMAENVLPHLEEGEVVILDRFFDSTTAYQGYGRNSVSIDEIHHLNNIASHQREPDLTIYMKLSLADAKKRMAKRKDRMELSGDDFYKKVIEGYDKLANQEKRFFTVDATKPASKVGDCIWEHVQQLYKNRNR